MPSKSKAQQRLMQAAEHGATFPMAKKLRASMTHQQLHDFAAGSEAGKPEHVGHPHKNLGKFLHKKKDPTVHESHAYDWRNPKGSY